MFGGINGTTGNRGITAGMNEVNGWVEDVLLNDDGEVGRAVVTMGITTAFPGGNWVKFC